MKKFSFLAVVGAIALLATVTSCSNKPKGPVIPEGEAIGNIRYFFDDTSKTISFIKTNSEGTKEVQPTEYIRIQANDAGFLVAHIDDDKMDLLSLDGLAFAKATGFEVETYFASSATVPEKKVILTVVPQNENHLAYDAATRTNLSLAGGIKSTVIPLDNGITIFENSKGWGFGPSDKEDATLDELKNIGVITAKGKFYLWVQSSNFTGIIDASGKGIKPMSAAAYKALQKKSKKLWEWADVVGIEAKAI